MKKIFKHRYLFLLVLGIIIHLIWMYLSVSFKLLSILLSPFVIITILFWSIITKLNNFNMLEPSNLTLVELSKGEIITFPIFGGMIFSIILYLILHKNNKIKKIVQSFILIIFIYSLILELYPILYSDIINAKNANVGSGNLLPFFRLLMIVISIFFLINYIKNNKIDFRTMFKSLIKYLFLLLEIMIVFFISILFLNWNIMEGATIIDNISMKLLIFITGFLFFYSLEEIKGILLKSE